MSEALPAVELLNVNKDFPLARDTSTLFRSLRYIALGASGNRAVRHALSDLNLGFTRGDLVGVVGNNGAGKTTLLKTIAGLYAPTSGQVKVRGEIAFLAGLGVGMAGDLSVRENLFLYGAICGLDRPKLMELFGEILDWSELQEFADAPLRTLSTGMKSRLAFAVARHVQSEVILMDEALSAGDARFTQKCSHFFEQRRHTDQTVIVATHGLQFVRQHCTKCLWLHQGRCRAYGEVESVLREYAVATGTADVPARPESA